MPRARVIAAQAAAVALLVLVVYGTLLREDPLTPLPDIQAPGVEQPAPSDGDRAGDGDPAGDDEGSQGDQGDSAAGLAGPLGAPTGAGGVSPAFRPPTPPADQYADAASNLISRVRGAPGAAGDAPGAIDP